MSEDAAALFTDARTSLIGSIDHERSLPLYQRMVPNPPTKLNTTFSSISSQLKMLRFTFSTVFNTVGATIRAGADRRATATPTKFIKMLKWPPMAASCALSSARFLSPGRFAHLVSRFGWFMQ